MGRLSAAALVVGMTWLALDGAASAQACTCGEPVDDTSRAERIASLSEELELLSEAVEAGEAVGPTIDLGSLVPDSLRAGPRAPDDDDLPWCINQNDAQCSKLPAGSVPASIGLGGASFATLTTQLALPRLLGVACDFGDRAGLAAHDGMRSQLERPPR